MGKERKKNPDLVTVVRGTRQAGRRISIDLAPIPLG